MRKSTHIWSVAILLAVLGTRLPAAGQTRQTTSVIAGHSFLSVKDFGAKGDGVTDDLPAFQAAIASMSQAAAKNGTTLWVPFGVYRLSGTLHITRQMILQGMSGSGWYAGTTLLFDPGVTGIIIDRANTSPDGGQGDWSVIRDIAVRARGKAGTEHGIWLKARALIENCYVGGFSGNGIEINASTSYSPKTNANNWEVHNCRIDGNAGHGFHVEGADANAGRAIGVDSSGNGGWGFYDQSFLGNTYVGCHAEGNALGAYTCTKASARNVFVGCYTEGGQPPNVINAPSIVVGGVMAGTQGTGYFLVDGVLSSNVRVTNAAGPLTTTLGFAGDIKQGALSFGASDGLPYRLQYGFSAPGWWDLVYGQLDAGVALSLSTRNASEGLGQVRFNNGIYLGPERLERKHSGGTGPPASGSHLAGEIVYNVNPAPGGYVGWVCTASGTPGTWNPFGAIAP